ncbi:hypothetical protein KI688_009416 [Linnemannia hyalina]|uniref:Uncharacterized protein n=1 Tax=Linnemannia hyalina TaxID=64524 RepID=A0A9P7XZE2_9FUNG|nr:hypothetical protein KI688_009416 [Linnemannia hyalina]
MNLGASFARLDHQEYYAANKQDIINTHIENRDLRFQTHTKQTIRGILDISAGRVNLDHLIVDVNPFNPDAAGNVSPVTYVIDDPSEIKSRRLTLVLSHHSSFRGSNFSVLKGTMTKDPIHILNAVLEDARYNTNRIITAYGLADEYSPLCGLDQDGVDSSLASSMKYYSPRCGSPTSVTLWLGADTVTALPSATARVLGAWFSADGKGAHTRQLRSCIVSQYTNVVRQKEGLPHSSPATTLFHRRLYGLQDFGDAVTEEQVSTAHLRLNDQDLLGMSAALLSRGITFQSPETPVNVSGYIGLLLLRLLKQDVTQLWSCDPKSTKILGIDLGQAFVVEANVILPTREQLNVEQVQEPGATTMESSLSSIEAEEDEEAEESSPKFFNLAVKQKAVYQPTFKHRRWLERRNAQTVEGSFH